jgi:hypothetical protein
VTEEEGKHLALWEVLEEWLVDNDYPESHDRFTSATLVTGLDLSGSEASAMINSHLHAQRAPKSKTLYVLKREGRTRAAVWSVGVRKVDVEVINQTLYEDIRVKVRRAFAPDLLRVRQLNPGTARYVDKTIDSVVEGAMRILAAALDAEEGEEEE